MELSYTNSLVFLFHTIIRVRVNLLYYTGFQKNIDGAIEEYLLVKMSVRTKLSLTRKLIV